MKKILFALAFLALLIAPSYAITFSGVRMGNPDTTTLTGVKAVDMANIGGLTFMKDYTVSDANTLLDATEQNFTQTNGSPIATYNPSRSASIASTKFTTSGDMTIVTTSNARRQTEGYMDESGFSLARGELIEGSAANLMKNSYFSLTALSSYFGASVAPGGTAAISNSTEVNPIFGTNTLKFVGSKANDGFFSSFLGSITAGTKITLSFYVKGTGTIRTYYNDSTAIFYDTTNIVATSEFTRRSIVFTQANTGNTYYGFRLPSDGNAVLYFDCMQVEAKSFPSSYIPTTTAAVTRAAEPLTYPTEGNINSLENISIVMRYRPEALPSTLENGGLFNIAIDGSNYLYARYDTVALNRLQFRATSGGAVLTIFSPTISWNMNESHILIFTASTTADSGGKKMNMYIDGTLVASGVNYVPPVGASSSFSIMSLNSGILQDFEVYQKALSQAEVTKIQTILTTEN